MVLSTQFFKSFVCRFFLLIVCFIAIENVAVCQESDESSKKNLEEERKDLKNQIEDAKRQLEKIKLNKKTSLAEMALLQKRINLRSQKIGVIDKQIKGIDKRIQSQKQEIISMKSNINALKEQYKKSILAAYKNYELYNPSYFLFSSNSFSSFIDKVFFLKRFRDIRINNLSTIRSKTNDLETSIQNLSKTQQAQSHFLSEQRQELITMKSEEDEKKNIVKQLKNDESKLAQQINKKTKKWKDIKKAIALVIKKEIERSKQKIEAAKLETNQRKKRENEDNLKNKNAKSEPSNIAKNSEEIGDEEAVTSSHKINESVLTYSAKDFNLAKNFQSNKGKLPWPIDNAVVTMKFGKNKVTDESKITYDNSGLTIQTDPKTPVKAVFGGTVTNTQEMDDGFLITIRHGQYWTIYIPVQNLMIQTGQEVKLGQVLGFTSSNNPSELEFQILKETTFQNPELWLKK